MPKINSVVTLDVELDVAIVTVDSPPVNVLSVDVRDGLDEALKQAIDGSANVVLLLCEGRTFIAGADISEFGRPKVGARLSDLAARIEDSPKPVVAAIHGTALGGGLELALCAHYRVAVPSARMGLPEVNLGLLPGGGGTQRLPRIVGVQKALEMVTSGQPVSARAALEMGLIDSLLPEGHLRESAIGFSRKIAHAAKPIMKIRDSNAKLKSAAAEEDIFKKFRAANARKFRGLVAPEQNIRAIEAAVKSATFEEGIAEEQKLFTELLNGPQSAAQRYYFFAERQANKIPDVPEGTPDRAIDKVGIIGAGTMGGGIAMNFANVGIPSVVVEMKQEALDRGLGIVRKNYDRTASRGGLTAEQLEQRIGLITGSLSMEALADCDLVIEAVFERMDVKKAVFEKLDAHCKPGAILATNTSALNVDEIATATKRPEDVVGLHFFSPANVMKLLEVVRAEHTSKDVIATSMKLAKRIGKVAVLAGVCPGFIGNRMLKQRQEQATRIVLEGAMPWDVDRVLYEFGFPMGPFAMSDMAGIDLGWVKEKSTGQTLREVLCEHDRRGQKTKAGYYDYDENRTPTPSPVTEQIIKEFRAKTGRQPRHYSDQEILARCLYPMINEGAKLLEERKAIRASDIDVVWVNAYGWPVYRGGPMYYADQIGLDKVLATMNELHQSAGDDYKPADLLVTLVNAKESFATLERVWH